MALPIREINFNGLGKFFGIECHAILRATHSVAKMATLCYVELIFSDGRSIKREWAEPDYTNQYDINPAMNRRIEEILEEWRTTPYLLVGELDEETEEGALQRSRLRSLRERSPGAEEA